MITTAEQIGQIEAQYTMGLITEIDLVIHISDVVFQDQTIPVEGEESAIEAAYFAILGKPLDWERFA